MVEYQDSISPEHVLNMTVILFTSKVRGSASTIYRHNIYTEEKSLKILLM